MADKKGEMCDCGCPGCWGGSMGGWHGHHGLLRILIGIMIVLGAFFVGIKFGEIRAILGGYGGGERHSYYMMGGYGPMNGWYGMPMMMHSTQMTAPAAPATGTQTPTTTK